MEKSATGRKNLGQQWHSLSSIVTANLIIVAAGISFDLGYLTWTRNSSKKYIFQ